MSVQTEEETTRQIKSETFVGEGALTFKDESRRKEGDRNDSRGAVLPGRDWGHSEGENGQIVGLGGSGDSNSSENSDEGDPWYDQALRENKREISLVSRRVVLAEKERETYDPVDDG